MIWIVTIVPALTLLLTAAFPVHAQNEIRGRSCKTCRIVLQQMATLTGDAAPVGEFSHVARFTKGSYVAATSQTPGTIYHFSTSGRYLGSFGRQGRGPGEYAQIRQFIPTPNGIAVFDNAQARISILDSTLTFRTSWKIPGTPVKVIRLRSGQWVINDVDRSPSGVGLPFQLLAASGEPIRAFGKREVFRSDHGHQQRRILAPSKDGGFWASPWTSYQLEKWAAEGLRSTTFTRVVDWFKPHNRWTTFDPAEPPPPRMIDIQERSDGKIWVLVDVPDSDWKDGLRLDTSHPDGPRHVPRDLHSYFDTVIELLDPAQGRVVASVRSPRRISGFSGMDEVFIPTVRPDGIPEVTTYKLLVQR